VGDLITRVLTKMVTMWNKPYTMAYIPHVNGTPTVLYGVTIQSICPFVHHSINSEVP